MSVSYSFLAINKNFSWLCCGVHISLKMCIVHPHHERGLWWSPLMAISGENSLFIPKAIRISMDTHSVSLWMDVEWLSEQISVIIFWCSNSFTMSYSGSEVKAWFSALSLSLLCSFVACSSFIHVVCHVFAGLLSLTGSIASNSHKLHLIVTSCIE